MGCRRLADLATQAQAPANAPSIEGLGHQPDQRAPGLRVGVPSRFALAGEAGDHHRLRAAVLLDAGLAVAIADARLLPAAHRYVHCQVVDQDVIDVDRPALDAAGDPLRPVPLAEDRAGEPVA